MSKPVTTIDFLKSERNRLLDRREEIGKKHPLYDEDLAAMNRIGDRLAEIYWMIKNREKSDAA